MTEPDMNNFSTEKIICRQSGYFIGRYESRWDTFPRTKPRMLCYRDGWDLYVRSPDGVWHRPPVGVETAKGNPSARLIERLGRFPRERNAA